MIDQILKEIDRTISEKKYNPRLSELIVSVIANPGDLPQKFVDMIYDIHEIDTDTHPSSQNFQISKNWNYRTSKLLKVLPKIIPPIPILILPVCGAGI